MGERQFVLQNDFEWFNRDDGIVAWTSRLSCCVVLVAITPRHVGFGHLTSHQYELNASANDQNAYNAALKLPREFSERSVTSVECYFCFEHTTKTLNKIKTNFGGEFDVRFWDFGRFGPNGGTLCFDTSTLAVRGGTCTYESIAIDEDQRNHFAMGHLGLPDDGGCCVIL